MKIIWRDISNEDENTINSWLSNSDKHMLCLEDKSWIETANDISDCLKFAKNGQFKNMIGFVNNQPVVAIMLGVENSGEILHLYNIVVSPNARRHGIASAAVNDILHHENKLGIKKTYNLVKTSVLPENKASFNMFMKTDLNNITMGEEYIEFSKNLKEQTKTDNSMDF